MATRVPAFLRFEVPLFVSSLSFLTTLCLACVLAFRTPSAVQPLATESGAFSLVGDGFVRDAVYPTTATKTVPSGVNLYGSFVAGDSTVGSVKSSWLLPVERFRILIAGYPDDPGLSFSVETESLDGNIKSFPVAPADAREKWTPIQVVVPNPTTVKHFRLVAIDNAKHLAGWFGFSEPYAVESGAPGLGSTASWFALLALLASGALSVACFPSFLFKIRGTRT